MEKFSEEKLDFIVALKNMDSLFWRFSNLQKIDDNLSEVNSEELCDLYEKYSESLSSEKLKEVIFLLLSHRIECIDERIRSAAILCDQVELNGGTLSHYSIPDTVHTFKLVDFNKHTYTVSEARYYSRATAGVAKIIECSSSKFIGIKQDQDEWATLPDDILDCIESKEAELYLEAGIKLSESNSAIKQFVSNFLKLTNLNFIINNYIFYEYSGMKFSIDFIKQDILTENEFYLQW